MKAEIRSEHSAVRQKTERISDELLQDDTISSKLRGIERLICIYKREFGEAKPGDAPGWKDYFKETIRISF